VGDQRQPFRVPVQFAPAADKLFPGSEEIDGALKLMGPVFARARAVMLLNESNVDPRWISIAGYAQYHPSASNDTRKVAELTGEFILWLSLAPVPGPANPPNDSR
jgi:hypothetical protein